MHHARSNDSAPDLSWLDAMRIGLSVLCSELKWMILRALRTWEISQLRKRLRQELFNLGMAEAALAGLDLEQAQAQPNIFNEKELSLKQISFLTDEIKFLTNQMDAQRQEYVQRRVQAWGL